MPKIQRFRMVELIAVLVCMGLLIFGLLGLSFFQKYQICQPCNIAENCVGHMKMLGTAGYLYAADNAQNLPGPQPMGPGIPQVSWDRPILMQLADHSMSRADFYAPVTTFDDSKPYRMSLWNFTCPYDPDGRATSVTTRSYSENLGDATAATGIEPTADKIPSSKVISPAGTAWLVENRPGATVFGAANAASDTWIDISRIDSVYDGVHCSGVKFWICGYKFEKRESGVNVLMHDGHVELLGKKSLSSSHPEVMKYTK